MTADPLPGRLATPRSTVLPCCEVDRLVSRRRQNGRVVRVTDGRQTRNAERTRRAVLDAAVQVILDKGAAVTLAQVAAAAGVSKSGLIHHFGSRNQLVVALVEDTHERFRETVRSHLELSENYPGKDAPRVRSRALRGERRGRNGSRLHVGTDVGRSLHDPRGRSGHGGERRVVGGAARPRRDQPRTHPDRAEGRRGDRHGRRLRRAGREQRLDRARPSAGAGQRGHLPHSSLNPRAPGPLGPWAPGQRLGPGRFSRARAVRHEGSRRGGRSPPPSAAGIARRQRVTMSFPWT
ncbi:hypothetical protein C6W96_34495 [Streptomyces sp. CS149]|nr:hypothetical protein C6W96_34495 [Streptomyces sp. CS149]